MSYEEGLAALTARDFKAAVPLLEQAALETAYSSDLINHAYTLALHQAGEKAQVADVSFRIAESLLQSDPATALDYFQRAVASGLDAGRVRQIGEIHEGWAVPRTDSQLEQPLERVAHVLGSLNRCHVLTRYIKMLAAGLKRQGVQSTIFTTESLAGWFSNPTPVPQSEPMAIDADVVIASVEGNFLERAEKIGESIRSSGIQVAFYHASLEDQITARVAAFRPAPIQVNVNHRREMDADLFDGFIHVFQSGVDGTRFSSRTAEWIPTTSDIQTRLRSSESVSRHSLGIESASSVSATFGQLQKLSGRYLNALCEILNRFPSHFHLFAGSGDVRAVRSVLHSEGVLPRVRFLGRMPDVAPLLGAIDVYLASFPQCGAHSILEVMGAGKPVVTLRVPPDSAFNAGAELVEGRDLVASRDGDYIAIADRLLRNPALRETQGKIMLERFRSEFRPERLGERYIAFIDRLTRP